jgi:hypothetical protein
MDVNGSPETHDIHVRLPLDAVYLAPYRKCGRLKA